MIIQKPHLLTKLEIWAPRYSDAYTATDERVALLAQYKVAQSSPVILVEFTKANHLKGQRFAIRRSDVERYPIDSNGKIACYAVPMSKFESWETAAEVRDLALGIEFA
jgi:hypothetical protein